MSIQPKSIFISIQSHLDKFNSIWKQFKIHTRENLVKLNSSSTKTLTICYLSDILSIQYWINPREDHELSRKQQFEYSDTAISFLFFFSFFHSNIIRFQSWEQLDLNAYFSSTKRDRDDLIEPQDFKLPLLSCIEMKLLNSVK